MEERDKMNKKLNNEQQNAQNLRDALQRMFNKFEDYNNVHNRNEKIDIVNNIQCPNCAQKGKNKSGEYFRDHDYPYTER